MCDSGIEDFPAADDHTLDEGMRARGELGLPVAVHAEQPARLARRPGRLARLPRLASRRGGARGDRARDRPRRETAARCTSSTSAPARAWRWSPTRARRRRDVRDLPALPGPHRGGHGALGTVAKCAPPLRPDAERDALWDHLAAGQIAFVASDHSPCPPDMKRARSPPRGAASPAASPRCRCCSTRAAPGGRGASRRRVTSPRRFSRPRAARAGRRRRPRARDLRERHAGAGTATARTRSRAARSRAASCRPSCGARPSSATAPSPPRRAAV